MPIFKNILQRNYKRKQNKFKISSTVSSFIF